MMFLPVGPGEKKGSDMKKIDSDTIARILHAAYAIQLHTGSTLRHIIEEMPLSASTRRQMLPLVTPIEG
jgi:hypothetical protein